MFFCAFKFWLPGRTCATEFQSLERWNGVLKQTMPGQYHHLGLSRVTELVECGMRATLRARGWVSDAETVPQNEPGWSRSVLPATVCSTMVKDAWLQTERLETEDRQRSFTFWFVLSCAVSTTQLAILVLEPIWAPPWLLAVKLFLHRGRNRSLSGAVSYSTCFQRTTFRRHQLCDMFSATYKDLT